MISGFRREVAENCAVQGYYATSSGNFLPGQHIGPILRVEKSRAGSLNPEDWNYHYTLRNNREEHSSQITGCF